MCVYLEYLVVTSESSIQVLFLGPCISPTSKIEATPFDCCVNKYYNYKTTVAKYWCVPTAIFPSDHVLQHDWGGSVNAEMVSPTAMVSPSSGQTQRWSAPEMVSPQPRRWSAHMRACLRFKVHLSDHALGQRWGSAVLHILRKTLCAERLTRTFDLTRGLCARSCC